MRDIKGRNQEKRGDGEELGGVEGGDMLYENIDIFDKRKIDK